MDISRVSRQCGYICHTCIHIGSANSMSHSLILFHYRFMRLTVFIRTGSISALVQKEFGLIQIFLLPCYQVQFGKGHFGNLMSRHTDLLSFACTYLPAYTVSITDSDIKEITFSGSLVMRNSTFYHVSQVIEFMTQFLHLLPPFASCPLMRMLRVHGTRSIEITIRFLCRSDNNQHTINILSQFFIRIGL